MQNAHSPATAADVGHVVEGVILSGAALAMAADALGDRTGTADRAGPQGHGGGWEGPPGRSTSVALVSGAAP